MSEKIRYVIDKNIVSEVKNFSKVDGVIARGFDSLGNEIFVKNQDAGNARELMRVALEDDSESRKFSIIFIIGSILGFIILGYIGYLVFTSDSEEVAQVRSPIIGSSIVQSEEPANINLIENIQEEEEDIQIIPNVQNNDLDLLRLNFDYETLQREHIILIEEKQALEIKYDELLEKYNDSIENEAIYKQELLNIKNKPRDTGSEEFIDFLGTELLKNCEKASSEEQKKACTDLYYNFLENE